MKKGHNIPIISSYRKSDENVAIFFQSEQLIIKQTFKFNAAAMRYGGVLDTT